VTARRYPPHGNRKDVLIASWVSGGAEQTPPAFAFGDILSRTAKQAAYSRMAESLVGEGTWIEEAAGRHRDRIRREGKSETVRTKVTVYPVATG